MKPIALLMLCMLAIGCASGPGGLPVENAADKAARQQEIDSLFNRPIDNLQFGPGDHRLDSAARERLQRLVDDLQRHTSVQISLGGHTDNRGSAPSNLELSKLRVMSVVRFLVANGVAPTRLKPYGYGESQPVVSNATLEGRTQNRRIEMRVISQ